MKSRVVFSLVTRSRACSGPNVARVGGQTRSLWLLGSNVDPVGKVSGMRTGNGRVNGNRNWNLDMVETLGANRRILCFSTDSAGSSPEALMKIKLETELGDGTKVAVEDVSGGCGSAYNVQVESPSFKGKNRIAQQKLVYKILSKEIAEMHSIVLKTKAV